ncbi:MAG: AAA family ATPase [Candidatus Aenigmarchaeota archaeon]|nr:AAA family ATPase [Candidatus Aenigmarchaeota archaeon]
MDSSEKAALEHFLEILGVDLKKLTVGGGKLMLISGGSCSGKSSMARRLADYAPQFRMLNTGDFFREEAGKMGLSVGELTKIKSKDLMNLDIAVDRRVIKHLIETEECLVLTSRFVSIWHLMLDGVGKPNLSIALRVEPEEKMRRMAFREFEKPVSDLSREELLKLNEELRRDDRDTERYLGLYGLDPRSFSKYSNTIDTTNIGEEEVWGMVKRLADKFLYEGMKYGPA